MTSSAKLIDEEQHGIYSSKNEAIEFNIYTNDQFKAGSSGRNVSVYLKNKDTQIFNASLIFDKDGTQQKKFRIELGKDIYANLPNGGILLLKIKEEKIKSPDAIDFERLVFIEP